MMTPLRVPVNVHANQSTPNTLKTYPINLSKLMNSRLLTQRELWIRRILWWPGSFSSVWILEHFSESEETG